MSASSVLFLKTMFLFRSRRLLTSFYPKLSSCVYFMPFENDIVKIPQRCHLTRPRYSGKSSVRKETSPGSRYVPPSRIEQTEEAILTTLRNKSFMNEEEWDDFKSNLIESKETVSEETFGSIVMNVLLSSNQLELSHSFMKYLEQGSVKPNFLTYLKYISLCSRNHRTMDQTLILRTIDKVKAQIDGSPVLDMKRAEHIIEGLCATHKWRESFKYLSKLTTTKPSQAICNALACAAIRNNEENLAWEILMKWKNCYDGTHANVIKEFLLVALDMQKSNSTGSEKLVLKLFSYMESHNIIINLDAVKLIEEYFRCHPAQWNITYTKVNRKGVCANCEHTLKSSQLENDEFKILCDAFLQRAVMKSDVFINTTSKEFENFMKFIDFHKPFHIVLDGLNAAHSYKGLHQNNKNLSHHLLNIVKILSRKQRKLLVVGRKHMQVWPKFPMIKISQQAKMFCTDNISQDDPFVVYAALASGPHTLFLSDDLMRDHASRLEDPKLIHLFKKWQQSHQIFIQCDEYNTIKLVEPVRHNIAVQGNLEHGLHIPFDDKIILDPYEELNNWLCIKRVT